MTNPLPAPYSQAKTTSVLLNKGTRHGCLLSPLLFNIVLEVLDSNQTRRRNKRHPNWKGRSKMSLFADDMILYTENPKDSTKKLLELINEFRKRYKINIQKSVAFYMLIMNYYHFYFLLAYRKQSHSQLLQKE